MNFSKWGLVVFVFLFAGFLSFILAKEKTDSLLTELSKTQSKSIIFNQLAEITLEDSLNRSFEYAQKASESAMKENDKIQLGIAWFNIAEAYSM